MFHANLKHFDCSGIYIIRNIKTNLIYIGSAKSIRQRLHEHKSMLRRNKHHAKHLQFSYNKNPNYFLFSILEKVNIQYLIKREQYYLNRYLCYKKEYGYNNVPTAYSSLGRVLSEETKKKISEAHKNMKKPWSNMNHFKKKIKAVLDTEELFFNSVGEAATYFNINRNTISRLLLRPGKKKSKFPKFYYL